MLPILYLFGVSQHNTVMRSLCQEQQTRDRFLSFFVQQRRKITKKIRVTNLCFKPLNRSNYNEKMDVLPSTGTITSVLIVAIMLGVVYLLDRSKLIFNRRLTSDKRRIIAGLVISIFLIAANLNGVYRTMNHYKLLLIDYTDLKASSPISIPILNQPYTKYVMKGYSYINKEESMSIPCRKLQIRDAVLVSPRTQIDDDLKQIRRKIYRHALDDYPMAANCFLDGSDESEDEILLSKWWRFGGSSVWLEKYQIHYMVSRIIYSDQRLKSDPTISVLKVQVFDKNWNELKDHTIEITNSEGKTTEIHYPDILKIPIDLPPANKFSLMGPEDPRVLVRKFINYKGEPDEEPIIIFNMLSDSIDKKRGMHGFKPFDNDRFVIFKIKGIIPRKKEKNWVPFFNEDPSEDQDSINFIYDFDPLLILRCSFINGLCERISGPHFKKSLEDPSLGKRADNKKRHIGPLRGGTNMIPIPSDKLPANLVANDKKYWLGFPRSHIDQCGCLNVLYRPHLMIMSREGAKGKFRTEYISSLLDFNLKVVPWDPNQSVCQGGKGKSVLIPNSITYWDFLQNDNGEIEEDFMGLTLSEADSNVEVLHIRGLWNHILKILDKGEGSLKTEDTTKEGSGGGLTESKYDLEFDENDFDVAEYKGSRLVRCSIDDADYYCTSKSVLDNWYAHDDLFAIDDE